MSERTWLMFTEEGTNAVEKMMLELKEDLKSNPLPIVREKLRQKMKKISETFGEIYDTDVRYNIAYRLARAASSVHEIEIDSIYWDL
ncbi:MAG: hypothetical protein AAGA60_06365 [Cyanobacteria bacterium P01_E01_bin.42]